VGKVKIRDNAIGNQARCRVGEWDLADKNGRQVSKGTYLVKGVLKTSDGKSEKVSVIVGVRYFVDKGAVMPCPLTVQNSNFPE
jgi:hypothetical protein